MDKDKLQITLTIRGRNFPLTIDRNEEFFFREAARKLNSRIDFLYNTYPKADYASILTIVALENAIDCERGTNSSGATPMDGKIREWTELINRVISEE